MEAYSSFYLQEWAFSGTGKSYHKGPVSLRDLYTDADIAAEDCIISSLRKHFGDSLKIIGEEVRNQFPFKIFFAQLFRLIR